MGRLLRLDPLASGDGSSIRYFAISCAFHRSPSCSSQPPAPTAPPLTQRSGPPASVQRCGHRCGRRDARRPAFRVPAVNEVSRVDSTIQLAAVLARNCRRRLAMALERVKVDLDIAHMSLRKRNLLQARDGLRDGLSCERRPTLAHTSSQLPTAPSLFMHLSTQAPS